MLIQDGASSRPRLDHAIEMLEQRAVPAAHIADAFRLLLQRTVENLDDNFVHFFEIRSMSAAATPDVHPPIDEQFGAGFIDPGDARVPEKKRVDDIEERKKRDGHPIRRREARRTMYL